ncbi:hypothetical protein, partial [Sphaerisporangium krabiense]|uniref:hypothetical protein n=1 Tax=Sphaerisporangium krabiense TaxID=763782 RepID=UPI0019507354
MITMLVTTALVTGAALSASAGDGLPRLQLGRCVQIRWPTGLPLPELPRLSTTLQRLRLSPRLCATPRHTHQIPLLTAAPTRTRRPALPQQDQAPASEDDLSPLLTLNGTTSSRHVTESALPAGVIWTSHRPLP